MKSMQVLTRAKKPLTPASSDRAWSSTRHSLYLAFQDVVKTRMQLAEGRSEGLLATLRTVASQQGLRGLFGGVTPRAMKAAPACAIVLASYECMKLAVGQQNNSELDDGGPQTSLRAS